MRQILTILLLGIGLTAQASMDAVAYRMDPNHPTIHVGFWTRSRTSQPELSRRVFIFQQLAGKLASAMLKKGQEVHVYWGGGELESDMRFYTLGYSDGRGNAHNPVMHHGYPWEKNRGISIGCYDRSIDIRIALNLLAAAYRDPDIVKRQQNRFIIRHNWKGPDAPADTIPSLPMDRIWEIASGYDPLVASLMMVKIFRGGKPVDSPGMIDYYFQNDRYHFYRTAAAEIYRRRGEEADSSQYPAGQVLLSLANVTEIVGNPDDGHCIFSDDSTFYYLDPEQIRVAGPFVITGRPASRASIRGFHDIGMGHFLLDIYYYPDHVEQVYFDPESGLVIPDYSVIQDSIIALRAHPPAPVTAPVVPKAKPRDIPVLPFVMAALLSLSALALVLTRSKS